MGEPMDRSRRVFGRLSSFEEVFPSLEQATAEFTESDFLLEVKSGTWYIRDQGGLMPCGNPSCKRGGYELDREVREMLKAATTEKRIKLYCGGDEGSPQGRRIGSRCQHSIEATIRLRLKAATAAS